MSKNMMIIAAIAVVAVCCAGAVVLIADDGKEYNITYVLDGGMNSDQNPTTYSSGSEISLYDANKDDMYFYSWYLDEELTMSCDKIGPGMSGDLTLYAKWTDTLEGKGMILNVSGYVKRGFFTEYEFYGTETYSYIYYDEDGDRYFMNSSSVITYMFGRSAQVRESESNSWSGGSDVIWTYEGEFTISTLMGDKICSKWVGTDSEDSFTNIQYIGDDWIVYYMTYESGDSYAYSFIEYTYAGDFVFETSSEYEVIAYSDVGVTVSGAGTYRPGDQVTLVASVSDDTTFKGWYDAKGDLLSTGLTYTVDVVGADISIYALNTDDPDVSYESDTDYVLDAYVSLESAMWTIVNTDGGEIVAELNGLTPTYSFSTAGEYEVYIKGMSSGSKYNGYYTVVVNGDIDRTFTWAFEGKEYIYTLTIEYSDLLYYRDLYTVDQRQQGTEVHDLSFVTYTDPYVIKIAKDFAEITSGMTDLQVSDFVLTFTQYIEYQADDVYMGYTEYWKFPLETLFDQGGDCEDTAILYCAIVKAMGYETALFLLPSHMASGIVVSGCDGYGFTLRSTGKTYYYCETTATGYGTGDNPNQSLYNTRTVTVIVVI